MKKFIFYIIFGSVSFLSCKKTETGINKPTLIGSWHLYSFGSLLFPETPTGNITLTFETSDKYKINSNAVVTETGSYSLSVQHTSTDDETLINFSPIAHDKYQTIMNIHNDTLVLIPIAFSTDGLFLAYTKL